MAIAGSAANLATPSAVPLIAFVMSQIDRRTLLRLGAGAGLSTVLACAHARSGSGRDSGFASDPRADAAGRLPVVDARPGYVFLGAAEAAFVDAAVNRLIPADALGPGAVEAGVTVFIDRQLAGPFGKARDWYMQGPWSNGTEQQGYQLRRTPAEVYRAAIAAIDEHARKSSGDLFAALRADRQDALLHALEDGKLELGDVAPKTFFDLLWQNTQEGFFADPLYLGNRGFTGWKLIGYPGPRYNYVGAIRHYGERYRHETVGLMGRDPSRQPAGPL
jgi:gluconate 2-dehydrogenase gamma chain